MTDRDVHLAEMRPTLPLKTEAAAPLEHFQSHTLRPILKLQNPLMLTLVTVYLKKYCPRFSGFSHAQKCTYVRDLLKRDSRPKHMLVGMVAGHFTEEEFAFFVEEEAEIRRRLTDLFIQRIQDQIDDLCTDEPSA